MRRTIGAAFALVPLHLERHSWIRMPGFRICKAREEDGSEIARLARQLGYPVSDDTMRARLRHLVASPADVVFAAKSPEGELAGWIHGVVSQFLESDRRVEIGGLVVDEQFHRRGIGRQLVQRVEEWAVEHGLSQALVRCQTHRVAAHAFYHNLGYREAKTQTVFRKSLTP